MPEIKVLPEEVVSKIAAGEVIERPASVLKELIENSLDAGASKIEIEIKKAGRGLIRVHDDGRGMDREDLRLALGRHATSKLNIFDDIYSLATFGFRGEALYSVFAVSRLKMASFRAGADSGYAIEGEGGRVIAELPAPPVKGTTIEAADLFFNTPARAKFMKSDAAERAQLIKTVEEAALANLGVSFRLVIDGAEILSLPALPGGLWENLKNRAAVIFGKNIYAGLARVEAKTTGMAVYGLLSRPDALAGTRAHYAGKAPDNEFIFRFSGVSERVLAEGVRRLAQIRAKQQAPRRDAIEAHPVGVGSAEQDERPAAPGEGGARAPDEPDGEAVARIRPGRRSEREKEGEAGEEDAQGHGAVHSMANLGERPCIVKEKQTGICLEDDIIRYLDAYGRSTAGSGGRNMTAAYLGILEQTRKAGKEHAA